MNSSTYSLHGVARFEAGCSGENYISLNVSCAGQGVPHDVAFFGSAGAARELLKSLRAACDEIERALDHKAALAAEVQP